MKLLPAGRSDLISYMRSHIEAWRQDPAAIGLTEAAVEAIAQQFATAEAAYMQAIAARQHAEAATLQSNSELDRLRAAASITLGTIKVFAKSQAAAGSPQSANEVFVAAQIDVPLRASSLPAPEVVRSTRAQISTQGAPTIAWKPPHPRDARERAASSSGLMYSVRRQLPGEHGFTLVHVGKETHFTDIALLPGRTRYLVRASRGREHGPWTQVPDIDIGAGADVAVGGAVVGVGVQRAAVQLAA